MEEPLPSVEQVAGMSITSDNQRVPTSKDPIDIILQFYRGEIARSNTYRRMIDSPTNWAIVVCTLTFSLVLSLPDSPWFTPLLVIPVLLFLFRKEIHRTQKYHSALTRAKKLQNILIECIRTSSISLEELKEALSFDKTDLPVWEIVESRFLSTYAMLVALTLLAVALKLFFS